ncbi:hypothetical protein Tco_0379078 [Tanacetum coccineum]
MMTALELVNRRVTYQVDVCTRESSEFCTRHHDAQKDRAAVRAEIEVLRRERLAYEQESIETHQALARSEAHYRALEAQVTVLETEVHRHEWQRQATDDLAVQHIMRTQALEAGARVDTLEDTGLKFVWIAAYPMLDTSVSEGILWSSPTYPLGFKAAMIRLKAESPSTSHSPPPIILSHTRALMAMMRAAAPFTYTLAPRLETPPSGTPPLLPIPLPTPLPPFLLPSTDHCEIQREAVGYGITDTWYEMLVGMPGAPTTDDTELGRRMTEFATMRYVSQHRLQPSRATRPRARTAQLVETLRPMSTLQTQVIAMQGQQGPARGSAQPEVPKESGSSS